MQKVISWNPRWDGPLDGWTCHCGAVGQFKLDPVVRRASRSSRPRDTQRQRFCEWERKHVEPFNTGPLTLEEATTLAHRACRFYGLGSMPRVVPKHHGAATGWAGRIALPTWALKASVVLHEAAHAITDSLIGVGTEPGHGRTFVRIALGLYAWHFGSWATGLRATMRPFRLKVAPPGPTAPYTATEFARWEKLVAEMVVLKARIQAAQITQTGLRETLGARRERAKAQTTTNTERRREAARRRFIKGEGQTS
jgi:hypothetical protein